MPRLFYDTALKVYHLFKSHPAMRILLEEFIIDDDQIKDVCDFLIANDEYIQIENMSFEYNEGNIVDQIANLYGYTDGPPWSTNVSPRGVKLNELLNMTIYLYKFGNTDNFFAKNIYKFIPEHDREYIQSQPKMKLTIEALGRKLDDMEDRVSRMFDVIDIDNTPDPLLDYLGQNLGYEREDFSLSNVSFREILKNIIEIYKIKGTNYSFSFFFKFLGFDVTLKEFFFNRDVSNPESFPGVDQELVEYFLTTRNPKLETGDPDQGVYLSPTSHLEETRNLNEWKTEYLSLVSHGCLNPSMYMRGLESFNNDEETWHQSPWTYFKANLIEYSLDPFIDDFTLSANDTETIRKYVRFLSPTYLFTWINVNLRPWDEDMSTEVSNLDADINNWIISITKTIGDARPNANINPWPPHQPGEGGVPPHNENDPWVKTTSSTPGFNGLHNDGNYLDYEDMSNYLEIYGPDSPLVFNPNGENIVFDIEETMNESVGTPLRRNGVHIRQEGHPKYITDAKHNGMNRLAFDSAGVYLKLSSEADIEENWRDYSSRSWPTFPIFVTPSDSSFVKNTNIIQFEWEHIEGQNGYWLQIARDRLFNNMIVNDSHIDMNTNIFSSGVMPNDRYYWRVRTKSQLDNWSPWAPSYRFTLQNVPFPYNGETITYETIYVRYNQINEETTLKILWPKHLIVNRYHFQLSRTSDFSDFILYDEQSVVNSYEVSLETGHYYWRYKTQNINTGWTEDWESQYEFTVNISV